MPDSSRPLYVFSARPAKLEDGKFKYTYSPRRSGSNTAAKIPVQESTALGNLQARVRRFTIRY
jgi:hypothetical protein